MASVLAVCGVCNDAVVIVIRNRIGSRVLNHAGGQYDFPGENHYVFNSYPDLSLEIPEDCPESVKNFYSQGMVNLRGENWDAAGAMFRKALDVATKILAPDHKDKKLSSRINQLVDDGRLTREIGDWSHELRIEGNEAVHDEEPETQEDSESMQKFAEAFLRYAFTLPNLVAKNRQKRENAKC